MPRYRRRILRRSRLRVGRRSLRTLRRRYGRSRRAFSGRIRRFKPRAEVKLVDHHAGVIVQSEVAGSDLFGYTPNVSPAFKRLNGIEQGTTINGRIGNSVFLRYLTVRGVARAANRTAPITGDFNTGPDQNYYVRTSFVLYIIEDKQVNNVQNYANWTDVFQNNINPVLSSMREQNLGRFNILREVRFDCDSDDPIRQFSFTIPLMRSIRFNGPTVDALSDRNYFLLVGTYTPDLAAVTNVGHATYDWYSRLTFTDA